MEIYSFPVPLTQEEERIVRLEYSDTDGVVFCIDGHGTMYNLHTIKLFLQNLLQEDGLEC